MSIQGYHLTNITKGEIGKLTKIFEEVDELRDASDQDCKLMILLELSDIIGAIELYLENNFSSITITDLIKMSNITKRAFISGQRS